MKSSQLFLEIKTDLKRYKSKINDNNKDISENHFSIDYIMSKYNKDNFIEITNLSFPESDDEIDEKELDDFQKRIDYFFSLYAPDDEDFREFIKLISIYLTFIAKRPLHPPGIKFSDGKCVYEKQNIYYCTRKNEFIKNEMSLCKYCVCKQTDTK